MAGGLLVLGARGQIGSELCRHEGLNGPQVTGITHEELDITRRDDVLAAVRSSGCDAVVNAAGFTAVDRAEEESEAAFGVNCEGAGHVAEACQAAGVPLVHISTDYVFDGTKQGPYVEDDPVNPLGVYGSSKEGGERRVRAAGERHIILRTSWVFGMTGTNFVKTMLRLAGERDELSVVDDQYGCPTAAGDIALAILHLVPQLADGRWGTYHFCGAGRTSWFDFATEIFAQRAKMTGGQGPELNPVPAADYPTPARRPANSELDCSRLAAAFGVTPRPWREGLAEVLKDILRV